MLPMFNHKRTVSIIMAKKGKPDLEANPEVEAPGQEVDSNLKDAAADVLRAIESKSVVDLAKALESAYESCGSGDEESDNEEGNDNAVSNG
jgi:hypothetical protein